MDKIFQSTSKKSHLKGRFAAVLITITVADKLRAFSFSVHCCFNCLLGTITTTIALGFLRCTLSIASKPIFVFSIVIVRLFILTSICYHIAPRTFLPTYFSWGIGHSWENYILYKFHLLRCTMI